MPQLKKRNLFLGVWAVGLGLALATVHVAARPLVVAIDQAYPPFEFIDRNGVATGYNVAIMNAIAAALGLEITVQADAWHVIHSGLASGEIDVVAGMLHSPQRAERFALSTPYHHVDYSAFVRKGEWGPDEESELAGQRHLPGCVITQNTSIAYIFVGLIYRHNHSVMRTSLPLLHNSLSKPKYHPLKFVLRSPRPQRSPIWPAPPA